MRPKYTYRYSQHSDGYSSWYEIARYKNGVLSMILKSIFSGESEARKYVKSLKKRRRNNQ